MGVWALLAILANGLVSVPPSQWKMIDVSVPENGTTIDCSFEVREGSRVQMILLDRAQAERFHRGLSIRPMYMSGFDDSGRFRYQVADAGKYVLVIDNRIEGRRTTEVELRLELMAARSLNARTLAPERRAAVVAISLMVFGATVLLSARQMLKQR